jgi:hypothetical protein
MATTETALDKVFGAMDDGSSAVLEAVKSANERTFRLTKALFEEADFGRKTTLELSKKFVQNPTDLLGISNLAFDKLAEAQSRGIALAKKSVGEIVVAGSQTREAAVEVAKAGREAASGVTDAARDVYGRTSGAARAAVEAGLNSTVEKAKTTARRTADAAA